MNNINYTDPIAEILRIVHDQTQTHDHKEMSLAKIASDLLPYPEGTPDEFYRLKENGEICDLNEGHAPYSPRYILPDYEKFIKNGSKFLRLTPPKTLLEATNALLILYHHVHSVGRYPVFIGRLDLLLEPFVNNTPEDEARELLRWFLLHLDRTISNSFCQGNIGPEETKTGNLLLELMAELQNAVPNMSLRYDPDITPDRFATKCIATALKCANPAFAYDPFYKEKVHENYAIASCYNGLVIGGGAYTLTRIRLSRVAEHSISLEDFFKNTLPNAVITQAAFMDAKIRSIVEDRPFFNHDFLIQEGLIHRDRFHGLFGIVGLNECVDALMEKEGKDGRYGCSDEANQLGIRIMDAIQDMVNAHDNPYCEINGRKFVLHAQAGADNDVNTSPGARIAIGKELPLYDHLRQAGLFQHYFPSGVSDIFPFDETATRNPAAVLDVFKGAFKVGVKYIATYEGNSDLIRVSGYLIKRSDIAKLQQGEAVVSSDVALALDTIENRGTYDRKVRSL